MFYCKSANVLQKCSYAEKRYYVAKILFCKKIIMLQKRYFNAETYWKLKVLKFESVGNLKRSNFGVFEI